MEFGGFITEWHNETVPTLPGWKKLTPGDFSVAARQFEVMDIEVAPGDLFRHLREECKIKCGGAGKIEFAL